MSAIRVDSDFPGGNILVERIDESHAWVRQDRRDTPIWWFYWALRIHGEAGQTVRLTFTDGEVFGPCGPCISADGIAWLWCGRNCVRGASCTVTLPAETSYLAFCPLYTNETMQRFLAQHRQITCASLAMSERGRSIDLLSVPAARATRAVLLTARHHACEHMASYVLEGMLAAWCTPEMAAVREQTALYAIPFIDIDGVENGDQGKARLPHDHWQDYLDVPAYAATRALYSAHPHWQPITLVLDLHNPWIIGEHAEQVLLLEPEPAWQPSFQRWLIGVKANGTGAMSGTRYEIIPYHTGWNVDQQDCATYFRRAARTLAVTLEIPYARAGSIIVTPDVARAFGADLVRGLRAYLAEA